MFSSVKLLDFDTIYLCSLYYIYFTLYEMYSENGFPSASYQFYHWEVQLALIMQQLIYFSLHRTFSWERHDCKKYLNKYFFEIHKKKITFSAMQTSISRLLYDFCWRQASYIAIKVNPFRQSTARRVVRRVLQSIQT